MNSLFKSTKGKKEILELYHQKLDSLNIKTISHDIPTNFGTTHVLETGSKNLPPLLIIHGTNGCAPISLESFPNLSKNFNVYAVDVLAQPNKSEGTRLNMKNNDYGIWTHEVIKLLNLKNVTLLGFSFGGLIILKTLEVSQHNIQAVYLSSPAYIVNGNPLKTLFKVFIPMKKYMKKKNPDYLSQFLDEVFSEKDNFAFQFLSKVFLEFSMDFSPIPTIKTSVAKQIQTSIHLFTADEDIIFPGKKIINKAEKIFPNLQTKKLYLDTKHVLKKEQNIEIEHSILNTYNS